MNTPFLIAPGVVPDETTFSSKGRWWDVDKVRFHAQDLRPQTIGGWESFTQDSLGGVCRSIHQWTDNASDLTVAFGTHQTLEVAVGGGLYDITPAEFVPGLIDGLGGRGYGSGAWSVGSWSEPTTSDTFVMTWSLATYGETLIANPRMQTIFQWSNGTADVAVPVANAPENVTFVGVAETRQVMAFGCNEETSGDFNPLCIRFSNTEDPTDWTTSSSNLAGEVILEGGGRIVAAQKIGPYFNVWTDNALYLGQFTGSTVQPWKFDRIGDHCGLIGPNAAIVVGQNALWIGANKQFYVCPMGGEPQILRSDLQVEFAQNLTDVQYDKIVATSISEFGEVWWFYPDARDSNDVSRYISVKIDNPGVWSKGTLARTSFVDAGPSIAPIATDYNGRIYYHERGQSADGDPISWYMESADQYIGEADSLFLVKEIWPDFERQQGAVNLSIKTRLYPQGPQRTKGPWPLTVGKSSKKFLVQARIAAVRIEASSSPTFARLGKIEMDVQQTGRK